MEYFQERGRFNEDEEVEMISEIDKVPYSTSSQANGRWGSQFYEKNHKIWLAEHSGYDHQTAGSSSGQTMEKDGGAVGEGSGAGAGAGAGEEVVCIEREHMFDKVVTPSDVGKLNRLVIPKQHAEKYFPLDSAANEKGLLLNFEDRSGKPWRFRYSYWNSSQSYVMTKGWSRFVKEKKLYAGDIVSFERGAGESVKDRLYIDWRRRSDVHQDHPGGNLPHLPLFHPLSMSRSAPWAGGGGGGLILPPSMSMQMQMQMQMPVPPPRGDDMVWPRMNYGNQHLHHHPRMMNSGPPSPIFYLRSSSTSSELFHHHQQEQHQQQQHAQPNMVFNSVPVVHGKASAKRLRLFGVNLECPTPENPEYHQFFETHPTLQIHNEPTPSRDQSESPKNNNTSMSLDLDM
ncbi:hypothetical protein ACHQM5_012031 [Ranunculus cassubicifolius]